MLIVQLARSLEQLQGLLGATILQVQPVQRGIAEKLHSLLVLLLLDDVEEPGDQKKGDGDHQAGIALRHVPDVVLTGHFKIILCIQWNRRKVRGKECATIESASMYVYKSKVTLSATTMVQHLLLGDPDSSRTRGETRCH